MDSDIILKLVVLFIIPLINAVITHFVFGCGRRFRNGRKCRRWDCPNQKECKFSSWYIE